VKEQGFEMRKASPLAECALLVLNTFHSSGYVAEIQER
jgi:hypothetical protein